MLLLAALTMSTLSCAQNTSQETKVPPAGLTSDVLSNLRSGGLVLYFRHFATEGADESGNALKVPECSTQRNLSEAGREQAWMTGQAMRKLKIPVGLTLSGEFCRNRDSAALMIGRGTPLLELNNPYFRDSTEASRLKVMRDLRGVLARPVNAGTNTVVITHESNFRLLSGWMLSEGEMAVLRPDGKGSFTPVARVTAEQLQEAAKAGR